MDLMIIFKIIAGIVILSYTIYLFINDIKTYKQRKKHYEQVKRDLIKKI